LSAKSKTKTAADLQNLSSFVARSLKIQNSSRLGGTQTVEFFTLAPQVADPILSNGGLLRGFAAPLSQILLIFL